MEGSNGQPIVTASCRLTRKAYRRFFFHWLLDNRKSYYVSLSFCLLISVAFAYFYLKDNGLYGFLFLFWLFFIFLLPKRHFDQHREMYEAETIYVFFEDHLRSRCAAMGTIHYKATPYENFSAAAETKSAFYLTLRIRKPELYCWRDQYDPDPYNASVILDKQCLTDGQAAALRDLLARKFGEKFRSL